jgi:hypothetical protein
VSLEPWGLDDTALDAQADEFGLKFTMFEVDFEARHFRFELEYSGRAEEAIRQGCAETGLEPDEFVSRLFIDAIRASAQRSYVERVAEEEQLWRMLALRTAGRATLAELQTILDRLAEVQADNLSFAEGLPLERDPYIARLHQGRTDADKYWPPLPKPSRAGKGGRRRFDEGDDNTWIRQLVAVYQLAGQEGLPLIQAATRLGVSEWQLTESRRRVGLLD